MVLDRESLIKGLIVSCIDGYLKENGKTTRAVLSADKLAPLLGYEDAQSDEAREAIFDFLQTLLNISISVKEPGEEYPYYETRIATSLEIEDDECRIDLVDEVFSLFTQLDVYNKDSSV